MYDMRGPLDDVWKGRRERMRGRGVRRLTMSSRTGAGSPGPGRVRRRLRCPRHRSATRLALRHLDRPHNDEMVGGATTLRLAELVAANGDLRDGADAAWPF